MPTSTVAPEDTRSKSLNREQEAIERRLVDDDKNRSLKCTDGDRRGRKVEYFLPRRLTIDNLSKDCFGTDLAPAGVPTP